MTTLVQVHCKLQFRYVSYSIHSMYPQEENTLPPLWFWPLWTAFTAKENRYHNDHAPYHSRHQNTQGDVRWRCLTGTGIKILKRSKPHFAIFIQHNWGFFNSASHSRSGQRFYVLIMPFYSGDRKLHCIREWQGNCVTLIQDIYFCNLFLSTRVM